MNVIITCDNCLGLFIDVDADCFLDNSNYVYLSYKLVYLMKYKSKK